MEWMSHKMVICLMLHQESNIQLHFFMLAQGLNNRFFMDRHELEQKIKHQRMRILLDLLQKNHGTITEIISNHD